MNWLTFWFLCDIIRISKIPLDLVVDIFKPKSTLYFMPRLTPSHCYALLFYYLQALLLFRAIELKVTLSLKCVIAV